jgi:hypothetical protein
VAPGPDDGGRIVDLTVVHTRSEAELLVSRLRAEGLRAAASADDGGGWGPNVGIEGVRVLVLEDDLERARALIGADASGSPPPRPPRPTKRRRAR